MRFTLIDRIVELEPRSRIVAIKNLSLAEEYLADHFPGFPVMPGVLMVEAMTQAAAWLIRISEDYQHSVIVLKQARGVKYGSFVQPGRQLTVHAEIVKQTDTETEIRGKGAIEDTTMVTGRLTLERYNLRDRNPALQRVDREIVAAMKMLFPVLAKDLLLKGGPLASAVAAPGAVPVPDSVAVPTIDARTASGTI
jgi:3-hydroxyacyl-[acyl-carrier-protein] dehydratase